MNRTAQASLEALGTLRNLDGEPSFEQRERLARFTGWGALAPALSLTPSEEWLPAADLLDTLVDADALNVARDVCDTSFFTPGAVTGAVFDLLRTTGFTGGRVLEPGCGSGSFMGQAPADWDIDWTGVDIDPTAAAIARALHPRANIITGGLQTARIRSGSFDAVVGNVPFSKATVHDPFVPSSSLHEYFLLRAIDAVKPGGYVIVATSRYVLDSDKPGSPVFQAADLVSAVRLPSGAFPGTDVVADVLVLRRRPADGCEPSGWVLPTRDIERNGYTAYGQRAYTITEPIPFEVTTGANRTTISGRWTGHEACIAGELVATGFDRVPLRVVAGDIPAAIAAATEAAAECIEPDAGTPVAGSLDDVVLADEQGRKVGSFQVVDGAVMTVQEGGMVPVARAGAELKALIGLRDIALELIEQESHPERADAEIAPTRAAALEQYTAYVAKFGPLNRGSLIEGKADPDTGEPTYSWRRPAMGGFRRDPDYVAVLALEQFDQNTGEAHPAPILTRRVGAHPPRPTTAASAKEALAISLGETRTVDLDRIAGLLSCDPGKARDRLAGLVFDDPETGDLLAANDYLSGDVRVKLGVARAMGDRYAENVAALEQVLPAELTALDIRPQLGATWISADDIADFTAEVFGHRMHVEFTPALALWESSSQKYARASAEALLAYGTRDKSPFDLLIDGLNGKAPTVYDETYDHERRTTRKTRNPQRTLAAEEKLRAIQDRFATWLWEDKDRADRVVAEYNRRFNSHVSRRSDGSYLTFDGLDDRVDLWAHQRDAVDRVISSERVIIAHAVGAGKTLEQVVSVVKLRQLGLARKPLIIVPNHLLEQIAREAQQAYPTGRFLIASKEDLARDARRLFAARCATGDWDAVVMTHQAFTSIPVSAEVEREWLEEQKSDLRWSLSAEGGGRRGAKQIATAVRKLEEQIARLRSHVADKDAITFEQLGVDHISVDEIHYFRRDFVSSRAEGFSLGSSKRATDLRLKVSYLAGIRPGKPVFAGYTGTLLSNTLAECYVWQRLLQPERLAQAGVARFDAWAATFVQYETNVEVAPDGSGFRMHRRPSAIRNVPELSSMISECCDILRPEDLDLDRPEATWETVVCQPSPAQAAFVTNLAERAEAIRDGSGKDDGDNMLVVCNDGRRVALDPQLVGLAEDSSKVAAAAAGIARRYHAEKDRMFGRSATPGSLQLVLCDIGTPHPGDAQTYGRLRAALVDAGVPMAGIRFIHEATTDKARAHLFAQCREGAVSVLVGSTEKVGVGTNVQTRLTAVHHLDAPWRPSDVEQREGRAIRPGNLSGSVDIYRYVTERTFDAFMWETLTRKARFIAQFFANDGVAREVADISDTVLSFGEVKALAAGNPLLLRQAELAADVRRLLIMRSVWSQTVNGLNREAATLRERAAAARSAAEATAQAAARYTEAGITDLGGLAGEVRSGNGSYTRYPWRGLNVAMSGSPYQRETGPRLVQVLCEYRQVHSFTVPVGVARRAVQAVEEFILAALQDWADRLPGAEGRLLDAAARNERQADEAAAAAERAVFEHEFELREAESLLDRVTREIAEEVPELTAA